jgi:hypothetical protein
MALSINSHKYSEKQRGRKLVIERETSQFSSEHFFFDFTRRQLSHTENTSLFAADVSRKKGFTVRRV